MTVSAVAGAQTEAGDFTLSTNTTLSFAADAGDSTGTVTITAVDNAVHNDDRTVTVSGTASASGVAAPADVTVTIDNEDMRGVTVSVTTLSVPEGGDAQYTVVLDTQPTGDVTVTPALAAGGDTDLTLDSTAALTFTATNWNTPQSVQVNARADTDTTDGTASVTHAVSGADYAMVSAASVAITESDSGTANTAPVIDTESPIEVDEQTTTVATLEATDAEGNTLSWLTKGGADVNKFNLTGEGVLAFNTAPSYENPVDTDMDNAYVVNVRVSDGTATADLVLTVNVVNVDEQPDQPATSTVSATPGSSTSLDVSWSAPGLNDGPAITQYDLQYRKGTSGGFTDGPQDVTGTSSTLAGLEPNTLYQVQVRAKNGETPSEWSEAGDGTTTAATPVEGQDLSATGMFPAPEAWGTQDYHGAVALCWTPPGMSPGDDFEPDSYEFRYRHYGPGLAEYRNGGGRTAADFRPWRDAPRQHPHATAANRQHMTPCNGGGGIGFNDHVMIGYEYTYQIRATRTSDGSSVVSDAITGISYNPDKPLHTTIRTVDEILEEDALEPDGLMALVPNPVPESMGSFVAGLCFANGQPLLIHCGPVEGFDIAADLTLTECDRGARDGRLRQHRRLAAAGDTDDVGRRRDHRGQEQRGHGRRHEQRADAAHMANDNGHGTTSRSGGDRHHVGRRHRRRRALECGRSRRGAHDVRPPGHRLARGRNTGGDAPHRRDAGGGGVCTGGRTRRRWCSATRSRRGARRWRRCCWRRTA